jgi:protein-S-isoprenylcysteine O-methyltransferase Ste14
VYRFFIPLLIGFAFNLASAFTAEFSRRWGERRGAVVSAVLRDLLGIPVWATGFFLAARDPTLLVSSAFVDEVEADGLIGVVARLLGWSLIALGGAVILAALVTIRQRALAPSAGDSLAQTGLYAHVRHPIHSGTLLEFFGLFLVLLTRAMALSCYLGVGWVLLQTRCEEYDLLRHLPGYRAYMQRVPRFLPRLKSG